MQISDVFLAGQLNQELDMSQLRIGQRLPIEVLKLGDNQEGLILLGGKIMKAKLEAQVQTGERFWAAVKEIDQNGIVLSRENINAAKINLSSDQIMILLNRGLAVDPGIVDMLAKFAANPKTAISAFAGSPDSKLNGLMSLLLKMIPNWSEVHQNNGRSLYNYLMSLGLEHEKSLYRAYKNQDQVLKFDLPSLKNEVLKLINDNSSQLTQKSSLMLNALLNEITGQQLWIQSGVNENAYILISFVLQDGGSYYNVRVAAESSRKGRKIDLRHCHLALQVETAYLGRTGIDLLVYENTVNICFLNDDAEELQELINTLEADLAHSLKSLGQNIQSISVKKFADYPQFEKFISGKYFGGVDIKG